MEYILYIRKNGDADYMENIALTSFDVKEINEAAKVCETKGFITRIATYNGEAPNFSNPNLINIWRGS